MFHTYILQSQRTHRYYTGFTEDLEARLKEHNSGENKSTRYGIPWRVVHAEQFATRKEAMQRERQIKNRGADPTQIAGVKEFLYWKE